jgi:hypothetical protein
MDLDPQNPRVSPILGQLLWLSKRREVAIYLRDGSLWIADFIDGHGELVDPAVRGFGSTAARPQPDRAGVGCFWNQPFLSRRSWQRR